ncbi:MAG: hypothetical protein WB493_09720 [Anaeromyxobacteraceae bacterium]
MIHLLSALATCASGFALLRALRLASGTPAVDVPLGWLVGAAWYALGAFSIRAFLGVGPGGLASALILALPVLGWALVRVRTGSAGSTSPATTVPGSPRLPRPTWIFGPMAAWTVLVAVVVVVHGVSMPTHTDDAYRVRGLAPMLVATGDWSAPAREVVAMAGAIPAFVPALPWAFGAPVESLQVGLPSIGAFLALLALLVGLGLARGSPGTGWAGAFALTSMPLLAYHATSTYSEIWLVVYLGAAFAFVAAYGRWREPGDAGRAILLLVGAAMVKREGELLAVPIAVVLLAQVARDRKQEGWKGIARIAGPCAAGLVLLAARVATVGAGGAFPFLRAAVARAGIDGAPVVAAAAPTGGGGRPGAGAIFLDALFLDGNFGILYWVLLASLLLLAPRIRRAGLSWAGLGLAVVFAETAASALWLYPQFTIDHSTVHRSLLPVSAMAAIWLAALLVEAPAAAATPAAAEPRSVRRARRRAGARA